MLGMNITFTSKKNQNQLSYCNPDVLWKLQSLVKLSLLRNYTFSFYCESGNIQTSFAFQIIFMI